MAFKENHVQEFRDLMLRMRTDVRIVHDISKIKDAYYLPIRDEIHMPCSSIINRDNKILYYHIFLHELAHWGMQRTCPHFLLNDFGKNDEETTNKIELRAEIVSFLLFCEIFKDKEKIDLAKGDYVKFINRLENLIGDKEENLYAVNDAALTSRFLMHFIC